MFEVVLGLRFKLARWYENGVFVDDCWKCCYQRSSKFINFRNKECPHRFVCWNVFISPQNNYGLKDAIGIQGWLLKAAFRSSFHTEIVRYLYWYLMLRICLSCFRWNAFSLTSSVCVRAYGPQLNVRIDFTSALLYF